MTIPLQFASLYDRQEVFVWSDCLLDLGTDFLGRRFCPDLMNGVLKHSEPKPTIPSSNYRYVKKKKKS